MNKKSIFGCAVDGISALKEAGIKNVDCFIDNDPKKQGTTVEGLPVVSLDEWKEKYGHSEIIIASKAFQVIGKQLEENGITDYRVWTPLYRWYGSKNILVLNPYDRRELRTEEKIVNYEENQRHFDFLNLCADMLWKQNPLFAQIEIETYNRCNGVCEFCPVSVVNEIRPECFMSDELFKK